MRSWRSRRRAARQPRPSFLARLVRIRGQEADLKNESDTRRSSRTWKARVLRVANVKRGERRRRPNPPFTTSTLQQDASNRLGMAASRTMRVAQDLYEGIDIGEGGGPVGLITYMRTDSVNVAAGGAGRGARADRGAVRPGVCARRSPTSSRRAPRTRRRRTRRFGPRRSTAAGGAARQADARSSSASTS